MEQVAISPAGRVDDSLPLTSSQPRGFVLSQLYSHLEFACEEVLDVRSHLPIDRSNYHSQNLTADSLLVLKVFLQDMGASFPSRHLLKLRMLPETLHFDDNHLLYSR